MQTIKWIYEKLSAPILVAYIILFSKPLGDRIVGWGWCTVNSPNCKMAYSLIIFLAITTGIGLLIELFVMLTKKYFWGTNILKITAIDSSNMNGMLDNQRIDNEFMSGIILYADLNIENKTDQEISKCYGTLEYIEPISDSNKERISEGDLQSWTYLNQFPTRILTWKADGLDKADYKISIAPKSKFQILRVGQLFIGTNKKTGKSVDFDFCNFSPIDGLHPFGLYKIRIRIDGKKKNGTEDIKPVFFNGWLLSEIIDESNRVGSNAKLESYRLLIGEGDPLKKKNRFSVFFAYLAFGYQSMKKVIAHNKIAIKNEKSGNRKNSRKRP